MLNKSTKSNDQNTTNSAARIMAALKEEPFRKSQFWYAIFAHRFFIFFGVGLPFLTLDCTNNNPWNRWYDKSPNISDFWVSFSNWDGQHYLLLAEAGYSRLDLHHLAFYPLFPYAIRAMRAIIGEPHIAALLIVFISTVFFARYFVKIAYEFLEYDCAIYALMLVFAFPPALFMGMVYTEGPFLALLFSWLFYYRINSLAQLIPAILIPLTRPQGFIILLALMISILWNWIVKHIRPSRSDWLSICGQVGGICLYLLLMHFITGSAWTGFRAQETFNAQNSSLNLLYPYLLLVNLLQPTSDWFALGQGALDKLFMFFTFFGAFLILRLKDSLFISLYMVLSYAPAVMGTGQSYFRYSLIPATFLILSILTRSGNASFSLRKASLQWISLLLAIQLWALTRFAVNLWVA